MFFCSSHSAMRGPTPFTNFTSVSRFSIFYFCCFAPNRLRTFFLEGLPPLLRCPLGAHAGLAANGYEQKGKSSLNEAGIRQSNMNKGQPCFSLLPTFVWLRVFLAGKSLARR